MNMSNLADLFHQNSIFQQNKPFGQKLVQPPVNDMLQRLSENLLTAQEQSQDLKKRFDTLELSIEAVGNKEKTSFGEVPKEVLEIYLNQYKVAVNLGQQNEESLMEYRNQLSAFDQTIQEYQDMLDGKMELPGMMNKEGVSMLLERTRAARERFLQEGAKELNRIGRGGLALDDKARRMVTNDKADGQTDFRWSIDTSAEDIYAEIDRALALVHKATSMCQDIYENIWSYYRGRRP